MTSKMAFGVARAIDMNSDAYQDVDDPTPIEEYNLYLGKLAHPVDRADNLREFHDDFMIDLQPYRDAAHAERMQRDAAAAERQRERMRERSGV